MHEAFMQFIVNISAITLAFLAFIVSVMVLVKSWQAKDAATEAVRKVERLDDRLTDALRKGGEYYDELKKDIIALADELTDAAVEIGLVYTEGESAGWKKPRGKR